MIVKVYTVSTAVLVLLHEGTSVRIPSEVSPVMT